MAKLIRNERHGRTLHLYKLAPVHRIQVEKRDKGRELKLEHNGIAIGKDRLSANVAGVEVDSEVAYAGLP